MSMVNMTGNPPVIFAGGRLTYQSGVPVPVTDQNVKADLFYTPYQHNLISYYDGSVWRTKEFPELGVAVPAGTNLAFDVFVYDNAGTLSLELSQWTDLNNRATGLVYQNGILVKSGNPTRRYLGSFRILFDNQGYDSLLFRWLWNYYNRVDCEMLLQEAAATWTYSSNAFRIAHGINTNKLQYFCGLVEDPVHIMAKGFSRSDAASDSRFTAIGQASIVPISPIQGVVTPPSGYGFETIGEYKGYPVLGNNEFWWLEKTDGAGTTTWEGQEASGIIGIAKR